MAAWDWLFTKQPPPTESSVPSEAAFNPAVRLDRVASDMMKEYVRSIYLWRCVDMIGQMASSVPLSVNPDANREQTAEEKQIDALILRPNPQWTGAALQYWVASCLAVANKCFLQRVRGVGGVTLELWPIAPNEVTIRYENGSRVIKEFEHRSGLATSKKFPVDEEGDCDLLYIRRPALNDQTDKSPAAVAAAPAEVFTRILQRCADIVSNSSNITGLLSTETEIVKKELAEIKEKINQFKTGRTESGGTLVTANAKWGLTRLSEDPAQALSVEIKDSLARDVCMTFGVPSQLVGIPGQDTYNNIAAARIGFLTDTVLPGYINLYTTALAHALLKDEDSEIAPDLERLPAMTAYRLQLVETATRATMLSVNEQRMLLGYPPITDNEAADVPVILEEMNLKRLAIEVQGGNVQNLLDKQPT